MVDAESSRETSGIQILRFGHCRCTNFIHRRHRDAVNLKPSSFPSFFSLLDIIVCESIAQMVSRPECVLDYKQRDTKVN